MADACQIRAARSADLAAVLRLEAQAFADPWSMGMFRAHLDDLFLVAELDERVTGYLVGRTAHPEAEILNVAVAPGARRRGIGRALLDAALLRLERDGIDVVVLEVRASNAGAQRLYEVAGFHPVGVRRGYYAAPREDALVLRRDRAPGPR